MKSFHSSLMLCFFLYFIFLCFFIVQSFCCAAGSLTFCCAVCNLLLILSILLDDVVSTRRVILFFICFLFQFSVLVVYSTYLVKLNTVLIADLMFLFTNFTVTYRSVFIDLFFSSLWVVFNCSFEFLLFFIGWQML